MIKKKKIQTEENNEGGIQGMEKEQANGSEVKENIDNNVDSEAENVSSKEDSSSQSTAGAEPDKEVKKEPGAEEKLAEMQDKYLRLSAEFDNYRKRTLREKIELTKHAGENILISIVPVMDDFERALKHMETSTDTGAIKSGIDLIYNKFRDFLTQHGIKEIEALNTDFNVDLHDAVTKVPVQDEKMKGKVVDVVLKGYWLHEKVMRHSKVVVGE
jgi:molecular chaperone GrpE